MKIVVAKILFFLVVIAFQGYAQQSTLSISIVDGSTRELTPARVRITTHNKVVNSTPREVLSIMYGLWDHADGFSFQPDSAFYIDGKFDLTLAPGKYMVYVSKGLEYVDQTQEVILEAGKNLSKEITIQRWINMPDRGWYSADDHIHIRRSPREDSLLLKWLQAENINVGVMLRMGDFWSTYYEQYAWGNEGTFQNKNFLVTSGQEDPRTPELGHAIGIGASEKVRYPQEYYYYDKVFDRLHELGGLTGYAHHAETFHGYRGLTLDGLRNKVDLLEILQFCASDDPLHIQHYYHMLDLGFKLTVVAGSDFPWCGNDHENGSPEKTARIGNVRFYTKVKGDFTLDSWKKGLASGNTFATSGPIVIFSVNDSLPGTALSVRKGSTLKIKAESFGHSEQIPLDRMEIVAHGKVIQSVKAKSKEHVLVTLDLKAEQGMWIAARCFAGKQQVAHTTPVYVSVDGKGFHNPQTVNKYLDLSEDYLNELSEELKKRTDNPERQSWRYTKGLKQRITAVRSVISELRKKLKE